MRKNAFRAVLAVVLGVIIGIFSKWGDVIPGDNVIRFFGLISSGVVLWLAIGSFILVKTETRWEFSIIYSLFMVSMFVSYYLFSAIIVQYLYTRIILFWAVVFLGTLLLGNAVFRFRKTKLFMILFLIAAILFLAYDAVAVNGIQLQAIVPEAMLCALVLIIINKSIKTDREANS